MEKHEFERLRAIFLKAFASVPDPLRDEIIAVIDGKPFSWSAAYLEVKKGTAKAHAILEQLKKNNVIE